AVGGDPVAAARDLPRVRAELPRARIAPTSAQPRRDDRAGPERAVVRGVVVGTGARFLHHHCHARGRRLGTAAATAVGSETCHGGRCVMSGSRDTPEPVLRVHDLSVRFRRGDTPVRAVTAASFDAHAGECVALVGASGCGKSVLTSALLGRLPAGAEAAGTALLRRGTPAARREPVGSAPPRDATRSIDVLAAGERVLRERVRGRMAGLIPQSPVTILTPVRTIRSQLAETLRELGRTITVEEIGRASSRERVGRGGDARRTE